MADSNCTHDCSSCGSSCSDRTAPRDLHVHMKAESSVKTVIAVLSGKGGVGKSSVTAALAAALAKSGKRVGVLDADITGPSIPKLFGIGERAVASSLGIEPVETAGGIRVMSLNLLMDDVTDPVLWRGPMLNGVLQQFYTDVHWGDLDVLLIDMPPGTGDTAMTVFQSFPVDGIVMVTSPQELATLIVTKAVKMAAALKVPILGLIENFAYFRCPDCGKEHEIFGESHTKEIAEGFGIPVLARLPIDPALAKAGDAGEMEKADLAAFDAVVSALPIE